MIKTHPSDQQMLAEASHHLRSAIDLLDRAGAAGHIAAHADLALNELDRLIAASRFRQSREPGDCVGTAGSS
jgi:hypothetical protein